MEVEELGVFESPSGPQLRIKAGPRLVTFYSNKVVSCTCGYSASKSKLNSPCEEVKATLDYLKREGIKY